MLKKKFRFTDYNGTLREEEHYFNITRAEATKLEMGTTGGLVQMINSMIQAQDSPALIELFDKFISLSYGKKSPDGRRFMKSEEISREFKETEAYNQLFMELITDSKKAAEFMNGIISVDEVPENGKVVDISEKLPDNGEAVIDVDVANNNTSTD